MLDFPNFKWTFGLYMQSLHVSLTKKKPNQKIKKKNKKAYQSRQAPMKSKNHKSSCAVLFSKVFPFQITCPKKKTKTKVGDIFTLKAEQDQNRKSFSCKRTLHLLGEVEHAVSPDKRQITCPFLAEGIDLRQD